MKKVDNLQEKGEELRKLNLEMERLVMESFETKKIIDIIIKRYPNIPLKDKIKLTEEFLMSMKALNDLKRREMEEFIEKHTPSV